MNMTQALEHPDFAGILWEQWRESGDERMLVGEQFAPRSSGARYLEALIAGIESDPIRFTGRALFYGAGV